MTKWTRRQLLRGGAAAGLALATAGVAAAQLLGDAGHPSGHGPEGGQCRATGGGSQDGRSPAPGESPTPGQGPSGGPSHSSDFRPRFGADGLVTNEWAFRNPNAPGAHDSPYWFATSGSLFAADGLGWTGRPDAGPTGPDSACATDSAVFRLVSRRRDFGPVAVSFSARLLPPITTARTPERDWDGAHVWLRYQGPSQLYALSFRRRDGAVIIKRKVTAHDARTVDGGDYATVAQAQHAVSYGDWNHIEASAVNTMGGVLLRLVVDGAEVLRTVDHTPGPLAAPGGVGLRADNTELWFRDFRARNA